MKVDENIRGASATCISDAVYIMIGHGLKYFCLRLLSYNVLWHSTSRLSADHLRHNGTRVINRTCQHTGFLLYVALQGAIGRLTW